MKQREMKPVIRKTVSGMCLAVWAFGCLAASAAPVPSHLPQPDKTPPARDKPVKVFILAGDENVLEQGQVAGRTDGVHEDFYPNATRTQGEKRKHVKAAVYRGAFGGDVDDDTVVPVATGEVEIGDPRTRRADPGKRGRVPVDMTPFPDLAWKAGHTTVLRGYVSVKFEGKYEFHPGDGDSAFNVTTVAGQQVYRRDIDQDKPTIVALQLKPKTRYAFRTVFFKQPGHAFRLPLVNKPGTLTTVVSENPEFTFLKGEDGQWVTRDDVWLYDAHPTHNNTRAPARPLRVGATGLSGPETGNMMGVDLMLGHRLGDAFQEPVMLLRFGTQHPIWFRRGSRDLGHDFRPPSSGGGANHEGSWDVIHFNHGIHDTGYRNPANYKDKDEDRYPITVPIDRYEANLRAIVAKLKRTGATLVWATITPLHSDIRGWIKGDEVRYNEVALKIMNENGVMIDDLYAESLRQGYPKRPDVHSVGNLAPKVTETILAAIQQRETCTKPLPRVLMIGDSITGSYWEQVKRNLDGKAYVCKNPANAGHSDFGLASIDDWLDLKSYLLNGQEYLQLITGIRDALRNMDHVYPGYAKQGAELAGLIWFQGVADGASASQAADYETHLANLIRDLRKDLNVPQLPVVVAALAKSEGVMSVNQQKVFDAQMAVGNAAAYPEFAGSVSSIDTHQACRPVDQSPGGRDPYKGNAESYLEIGDAMGRAMLKLLAVTQK